MDALIARAGPLLGTLGLPPDKSICHRAVLAAALAEGATEISPWPGAEDCQRTLETVERLGAEVTRAGDSVIVRGGAGLLAQPTSPALFCGESGTTLRLVAGVLAGQRITATLDAGPSLRRRPMRRIVEPLTDMGAQIEGVPPGQGNEELYPPLTIRGARPLRQIRYAMPFASAQVKSAVIFAGLSASGPTTVIERVPTRDHTERMLKRFGVQVATDGSAVTVTPGRLRSPGHIVIPGDTSSASFLLVAAVCVPGSRVTLEGVGLNPSRTQLFDVLRRMGASLTVEAREDAWEPRGSITVSAARLRGITIEAGDVPGLIDELPALLVAGCCASGTTRLAGVGELRVKETDRVRSMVTGLSRLGGRVQLRGGNGIEIHGGPLTGAVVESEGDHRTAMSLAVAGLVAGGGPTRVRGVACIAKSYPGFFHDLQLLTDSATVKTVDNTEPLC